VQAVLIGWTRLRDFARALAVGDEAYAILGYDRLVSPEVLLRLAMGDSAGAREVALRYADAPVEFGGHGPRAFLRDLLGRHDDAAADGAVHAEQSLEVHRSVTAWRRVAARYAPASAQIMAQYGASCAEVERLVPGIRRWTGEPLGARTLLVQLVEGLGDQLQGLRLARAARDAGARVVVSCDAALGDLVARAGVADEVLPRPVEPARLHGDLYVVASGRLHETGIPPALWAPAPYVTLDEPPAPPPVLDGLASPRVGVAWAVNPEHLLAGTRSMPYGALRRLVAATPGVSWVSLQLASHPRAAELRNTPVTRRVRDAGGTLRSLLDTARLLRGLDLLVSVDSAPAHLAGAMGLPVWNLLGPSFDWRWGLETERTALYPSMRLLREASGGDWNAVADRVARELATLTA
jgi:hypothetical protein